MATPITRAEYEKRFGKPAPVPQTATRQAPIPITREEYEERVATPEFERKSTGFLPKARDFVVNVTGGGKLAEGVGMGIVAPKLQKNLSQAEQDSSDTLLSLQKRINEKKSRGENTTRLENTLNQLRGSQNTLRNTQEAFTQALPSNKEVIGSAARLATTIATPFIASKTAGALGLGSATTFGSGALRGAGAGAITGATTGAIQGAGIAAEQDKSTEQLLYGGLLGAVGGGLIGGALGAVTGGIGGVLKGRQIRKENFVKDFVSKPPSKKVNTEAIRQGRFEDPSFFKKATIQSSKRDIQLADAVDDVVSSKATLGENIDAIRMKVSNTNTGVKNYIANNKVPFNTRQLESKLATGKSDLDLVFASDDTAEKTYDAVVNAFMKNVQKKDTAGLFEARQTFDQLPAVQKLLQNDRLGENARKEIVLAVRRAANEYVAQQLPKGNQYRGLLLQESYMLEALGNVAEKGSAVIGKNRLQLLAKEYPAINWIIGGIATGIVGAAGIGVGSSIVGSTD